MAISKARNSQNLSLVNPPFPQDPPQGQRPPQLHLDV